MNGGGLLLMMVLAVEALIIGSLGPVDLLNVYSYYLRPLF